MSNLYMIEIQYDQGALFRFLHSQSLDDPLGDEDLGYGLHGWLQAAFGELAPKPWRLYIDRRRSPRLLGYCESDAEDLRRRMLEFADPAVCDVCSPESIASKPMPTWQAGRQLAFEIQCCPIGRKSRTGTEKDIFLLHADLGEEESIRRDVVYCDWAKSLLEAQEAINITSVRLSAFRLVKQTRQTQGQPGDRKHKRLTRPSAVFKGGLTVVRLEEFSNMLAKGFGRHRAFGYGMLLLRSLG